MASLSLCPQFETNLMSNRKVIELLLQLKSAKDHGKNYIKIKPHLVRHLLRNRLQRSVVFFHQCRSPSSSKSFHSVIQFRTITGTKTTNMSNGNSLGFSYCFSCRSFACGCLASLSRSHIFDIWMSLEMQPISP